MAFYQKWKSEPLVVDLWLGIQASCPLEGTLSKVKELMQHESFDLKIPNRVRALISQFASSNFVNFHNISGDGYKFLGDRVAELNEINPQIASRLMVPLTRWRKYDETRQDMMKRELARLALLDTFPDNPGFYNVQGIDYYKKKLNSLPMIVSLNILLQK